MSCSPSIRPLGATTKHSAAEALATFTTLRHWNLRLARTALPAAAANLSTIRTRRYDLSPRFSKTMAATTSTTCASCRLSPDSAADLKT